MKQARRKNIFFVSGIDGGSQKSAIPFCRACRLCKNILRTTKADRTACNHILQRLGSEQQMTRHGTCAQESAKSRSKATTAAAGVGHVYERNKDSMIYSLWLGLEPG